jgi:hypothetical protein
LDWQTITISLSRWQVKSRQKKPDPNPIWQRKNPIPWGIPIVKAVAAGIRQIDGKKYKNQSYSRLSAVFSSPGMGSVRGGTQPRRTRCFRQDRRVAVSIPNNFVNNDQRLYNFIRATPQQLLNFATVERGNPRLESGMSCTKSVKIWSNSQTDEKALH